MILMILLGTGGLMIGTGGGYWKDIWWRRFVAFVYISD